MNLISPAFILFFACLYAPFANTSVVEDLSKFEQRKFSQNGEDGVLERIFSIIGTTNKYFVEFGVEDGVECNTRNLRENFGWRGLMMDGFHENLSINLQRAFITAENINKLLKRYAVPKKIDLLSIDIDYNDFYIWKAITRCSPRVVVIEYNATHLPTEDKVVPYSPSSMWDLTNYYGASILSLSKLGTLKGYTLVYAEERGVNLFFIRNDVLTKHQFLNQGEVSELYRPPKFGLGPNGGHPADPHNRTYLTFEEALNL